MWISDNLTKNSAAGIPRLLVLFALAAGELTVPSFDTFAAILKERARPSCGTVRHTVCRSTQQWNRRRKGAREIRVTVYTGVREGDCAGSSNTDQIPREQFRRENK